MITTPVPAIDVHTHLFPERLAAAVRRALTQMYEWEFTLPTDPATFAAYVRERGTERFCILPYAHKPGMARSLNAWVAETARTLPGAIGFACVHQDDPDAVQLLEEAFDAGLRGIKLHHQVQMVAPDDPRLHPVYELMLARDLPILSHAGKGPTETPTTGAARFEELMRRYPDLKICVAHMGFPEPHEFTAMLDRYPRMYLDTSGLANASLAEYRIDDHVDRILFATDAPNIAFGYEMAITRITDLNLGPDEERKIFRENALRYLGMQ